MKRLYSLLIVLALSLAACTAEEWAEVAAPDVQPPSEELTPVWLGLEWVPNTNHTGLYVAQAQGYYQKQGLNVEIVQAQEGGTVEQLVAAGRLDFGISQQESVTQARVEELPIVSIAAIIQHNTSGFASRAEEGITGPAEFEGKKYGAFGSPIERAVIGGLMDCVGADVEEVEFVDIGTTDFFVATARDDVDFAWVFQGWTGVEAEQRGIPLNMVMINDLDCVPDYYTPVIITGEDLIAEQPELVRRFLTATSRGYEFAIDSPDEAAEILLDAAPELDEDLVRASQRYLAEQYQADASSWGEQQRNVWQAYAAWMSERELIDRMIDPEAAFTNEFLP